MKNRACQVIVLSGAVRTFSAGHDLTLEDQRNDICDQVAHLAPYDRGLFSRDLYAIANCAGDLPKPAADAAIVPPTCGDYFTANFDVGPRRAKEFLFANRFMTEQEAMAWGFVNRLFPAQALEPETLDYAERETEQ